MILWFWQNLTRDCCFTNIFTWKLFPGTLQNHRVFLWWVTKNGDVIYDIDYGLNRFSISIPTCPYAGLPLAPMVQELWLIVALLTWHHLAFLGGLTYLTLVSCISTTTKMSPLLPPPEQVIPIVSIVATDNVQECGKHHFGCSNTLLLA